MEILTEHSKEYMKIKGWSGKTRIIRLILRQLKVHLFFRLAQIFPHPSFRAIFFRCMGVNIGKNVFIGLNVIIDTLFPELVTIEDYVEVGDKACIYAHSRGSIPLKKIYPLVVKSVRICRGAWIGSPNVTILPGVTIGRYSVVAAGAVVVKNVLPFTVVGGVPAKIIKKINPNDVLKC